MAFNYSQNKLNILNSLSDMKSFSNENVLIYFPHGLGDWVMYNTVTPLLNTNNNIFMTGYGDNYTSVLDNSNVKPVYCGVNNVYLQGAEFPPLPDYINPDEDITRGIKKFLPASIANFCEKNNIKHFYHEPFFESGEKFPYNSKARYHFKYFNHMLDENERNILNFKLKNAISTNDNHSCTNMIRSRLQVTTNYNNNSKLIIISRYGITSVGKNWGHLYRTEKYPYEGDEAREFIDLCYKKNKNCIFISMEHGQFDGKNTLADHSKNCYSSFELFGGFATKDSIPYAIFLKSLFTLADIHIGCPTGPLGLSLLYDNVRTVGLYCELMPSWYFEPGNNNINIVSSNNINARLQDQRTFNIDGTLNYNIKFVDTPYISGDFVFKEIEDLL